MHTKINLIHILSEFSGLRKQSINLKVPSATWCLLEKQFTCMYVYLFSETGVITRFPLTYVNNFQLY